MSNYIKFWLRNALYATAVLFFGGTVIQTFLMRQGIGSGAVGVYTTILNAVNVLTSMFFSGMADRKKNITGIITRLMLPVAGLYLGFVPLCLFFTGSPAVTFWTVLILGTVQSFFIALRTVFEYKLPYRIIEIENYGRLAAADGVISGVFGILSSALLSCLFDAFPFYPVMTGGFIAAAVLTAGAALVNRTLRDTGGPPEVRDGRSPKAVNVLQLLRLPVFRRLIPANFMRGLSAGVIGMTAVIAIAGSKFSQSSTAVLVIALSAANLSGSLFFAAFSKRIDCRILCLASSAVMAVFALIDAGGETLFVVLYFIVCMGKIVFDYAVPTLLYQVVGYEIAGSYHAWRLILTTAGTAAAATLTGYLITDVPAVCLLAGAVVFQLLSGWVYFASPVLRPRRAEMRRP